MVILIEEIPLLAREELDGEQIFYRYGGAVYGAAMYAGEIVPEEAGPTGPGLYMAAEIIG